MTTSKPLIPPTKRCPTCKEDFKPREREGPARWKTRKYCSSACGYATNTFGRKLWKNDLDRRAWDSY